MWNALETTSKCDEYKTAELAEVHIFQMYFEYDLVCCSLMSHSVIFQLYNDGTIVQFTNLDLLLGTHAMGI